MSLADTQHADTDQFYFDLGLRDIPGFDHYERKGTYLEMTNFLASILNPEEQGGILIASPGGTGRCTELGNAILNNTDLQVASIINEEDPRSALTIAHADLPHFNLKVNLQDALLHSNGPRSNLDMPIRAIVIIEDEGVLGEFSKGPTSRLVRMGVGGISGQLEYAKSIGQIAADYFYPLIQFIVEEHPDPS